MPTLDYSDLVERYNRWRAQQVPYTRSRIEALAADDTVLAAVEYEAPTVGAHLDGAFNILAEHPYAKGQLSYLADGEWRHCCTIDPPDSSTSGEPTDAEVRAAWWVLAERGLARIAWQGLEPVAQVDIAELLRILPGRE